jgi:hypothetical protein
MASATTIELVMHHAHPVEVHLDESRLFVHLGENGGGDRAHWIIDSGVTNSNTSCYS